MALRLPFLNYWPMHMTSQNPINESTILRIAFIYLSVISIISFTLLFSGADVLARWMGDGELAQLLRTGSFVVLLMPVLALLKGSFQAEGRMEPVAYGQVVEQMVRVTVILVGHLLW